MQTSVDPMQIFYPKLRVGGFSRVDGTVEFYSRINALLRPDMTILDFGAGRGAGVQDARNSYEGFLRNFKGRVNHIVGVDIDAAVVANFSVRPSDRTRLGWENSSSH